jgi:hypothetical protein
LEIALFQRLPDRGLLALNERQVSPCEIPTHEIRPSGTADVWTITARVPNSMYDRGYAATREQTMADFKVAWERCPAIEKTMNTERLGIGGKATAACRNTGGV